QSTAPDVSEPRRPRATPPPPTPRWRSHHEEAHHQTPSEHDLEESRRSSAAQPLHEEHVIESAEYGVSEERRLSSPKDAAAFHEGAEQQKSHLQTRTNHDWRHRPRHAHG